MHNTKRLKLLRSLAWLANFKLCRLLRTYFPKWATIRCCWSSPGRIYCTLHSLICRWWVFCAAVTQNGTLEIIAGSEWDFVRRLPEDFNTKPVGVLGWSCNFSRRSAEVAGKADILVKGDPYLTLHPWTLSTRVIVRVGKWSDGSDVIGEDVYARWFSERHFISIAAKLVELGDASGYSVSEMRVLANYGHISFKFAFHI